MKPQEIVRFINRQISSREMTLFELAARTGLARSNLSRWLNGTRVMKIDQAHKILAALGYELDVRSADDARAKRTAKRRRG